ncbi:DUF624 domain-containing protein [Ruminococcus sp.]|uniref:DUF624 domain-containing protein n=1 Tax=Ruminococcus sp. TaxID=41978 RepID=UPI00386587F4
MNSFSNSAFVRFFTKFLKLLLAQLINAGFFAVFTAIFVLIGYLTGFNNIIVWCLGIIPSMPFFAGLIMIVRKVGIEKKDIPVVKTFFDTVKENFKAFLLHGVVTYAIIACSIFAFMYYFSLINESLIYGSMLTVYVLFSLILISMMFYVPIMSVTYELKLLDIYKNSFILVFGNILRNILAMLLFIAVSLGFILWIAAAEGAMLVIAIIVAVLFYPLISTYGVNVIIAKGLQENVGSFTGKAVAVSEEFDEKVEKIVEHQAIERADNNSDYVFVNGKMIKKEQKKEDTQK